MRNTALNMDYLDDNVLLPFTWQRPYKSFLSIFHSIYHWTDMTREAWRIGTSFQKHSFSGHTLPEFEFQLCHIPILTRTTTTTSNLVT